jgi:hypothetical protein
MADAINERERGDNVDNQPERKNATVMPVPTNGRAKPPPVPNMANRTTSTIGMPGAEPRTSTRDLSTVELVKEIAAEVGHLVEKQIALAKTELKADLKAEATMVGGFGIAALGATATVNLLLVTAALALAQIMSGWKAGLLVSSVVLLGASVVAAIAWKRRVRSPLARTQRTLREDVEWTKERLT